MSREQEGQIRGRIVASGTLELLSPLLLSSGISDSTDLDLVRDGMGDPCIPGTSWAGVVRDAFGYLEQEDRSLFRSFFGYVNPSKKEKDAEYQSSWITFDLPVVRDQDRKAFRTEERENVRIDPLTKTAEDQALFNYEILVPGTRFEFGMEVVIRQGHDRKKFEDLTCSILALLVNGELCLGSKTHSGYGRVKVTDLKYRCFDFTDRQDVLDWYSGSRSLPPMELPEAVYRPRQDRVTFDGDFVLRDSLIVREQNLDAKTGDEHAPDNRHLRSYGRDVLPGTSLKGVIRHRALAVLKVFRSDAEERIKYLFGWVDPKGNQTEKRDAGQNPIAIRGRVTVHEAIIESGIRSPQTRNRVDHFTGGVMETALFKEEPVWSDGTARIRVRLELEKNPENPWETGLLLQVLKDLWTGEIAAGGEASVGRGRLKGVRLDIRDGDRNAGIQQEETGLEIENESWFREVESAWTDFITEENHE